MTGHRRSDSRSSRHGGASQLIASAILRLARPAPSWTSTPSSRDICVNVCPTNVSDKTDGIPVIARQNDCQTCFLCEKRSMSRPSRVRRNPSMSSLFSERLRGEVTAGRSVRPTIREIGAASSAAICSLNIERRCAARAS